MRFVARLTIAIATLLASAMLCWAQPPGSTLRSSKNQAARPLRAAQANQPVFGENDGAWAGDSPPPSPLQAAPSGEPIAPGAAIASDNPLLSDGCAMCGDDGFGAGGCGPGGCGPGGCGPGFPTSNPGVLLPGRCNDLWTEVHSHRRSWVNVEALTFWAKGNPLPPLVTESAPGTVQSQAGRLDFPESTNIVFGNERVDLNSRTGGRINLGYWLIDGEFLGVEGGYFVLQPQNTLFSDSRQFVEGVPPTQTSIARPFTNFDPNLLTPIQDAALIAFPNFNLLNTLGQLSGSIDIKTNSRLQGANADLRRLIWIDFTTQRRIDLLLGYRFFRLDDSVNINDQSTFVPNAGGGGPITENVFFSREDIFSAQNQFHGGEIGLKYQAYHRCLSLELIGKVAFGNNHEVMYINGASNVIIGTSNTFTPSGLLTQPSNIGTYRRDVFAILPEGNINLRYDLGQHWRVTGGYTFMYMNRVQRSGDAIDLRVNPAQPLPPALPAFAFHDTTFWVHGVSGGVEFRW